MLASAVVGLPTGEVLAQGCTEAQDPIVYDPAVDGKPQDASDRWSLRCFGTTGSDFGSVAGGILTVNDNSTIARASYCRGSIFLNLCLPPQEFVYDFVVRVESVTPPSAWGSLSLAYLTGLLDNTNDVRVAVTRVDGVGFWQTDGNGDHSWLVVGGEPQKVDVNLNQREHYIRVVKDEGAGKAYIYLDQIDTPDVTTNLSDLQVHITDNVGALAITSTPGKAEFDLYSFRYRLGTTVFDDDPNCAADFNDDGTVGAFDLLTLLYAWGPCMDCEEDLDGNDVVGASDLLILLAAWGPCP